MATYRVWCRVEEVGPRQYLATVSALPESGDGQVESESRVFRARGAAAEACVEMAGAVTARLRKGGHTVSEPGA